MNVLGWERIVVAGIVLALVPWIVWGLRRTPTAPADRRTVGALFGAFLARWPALRAAWERLWGRMSPFVPAVLADFGLVVGLCAILVSAWLGIDLLEDVVEKDDIVGFDTSLESRVIAGQSELLVGLAEWISNLSAPWSVVLLTICVGVALVRLRRPVEAFGLFAAVAGTGLWTTVLKSMVGRARPLGHTIYDPLGDAFPSGHTSATVTLGVFLAWLLTRHASWRAQLTAAAVVGGVTALVAASRVYLSVHWLSDVLGGAALGVGWAVACILWTRRRLAQLP